MSTFARDLIVLQGDVDKNTAVIANLTHETAAAVAAYSGKEAAARKHLAALHEEQRTLQRTVQEVQQRVKGGPTVKIAQLEAASNKLEGKKHELALIRRELAALEGVLKEFIREEPLRLQDLFDVSHREDEMALAMLLDQRTSALLHRAQQGYR